MTGLEKIIHKIEQDSAKKCESTILAAQKLAKDISEQAAAEGVALIADAEEKAKLRAKDVIRMAESGAQLKAKQIVLTARVEAINEALTAAAKAMKEMPADDYFKSLASLALGSANEGHGEMRFSENDLKRLPKSFEASLNKALEEKGATLTISMEPAAITDGFILVYGDIEINCTFDALLEASRDDLKEKICNIIF